MHLKFYLRLLVLIMATFTSIHSFGQADPTKWTAKIEPVSDNTFKVITTCVITNPEWHLYAMKPGGDGTLIPPTFKYKLPKNSKLEGSTQEEGKKITEDIDGVGTIYYYKNKIVYTQKFTAQSSGNVAISINYQTCNDATCLPPKTLTLKSDFKVEKKNEEDSTLNSDSAVIDTSMAKVVESSDSTSFLGTSPIDDNNKNVQTESPSESKNSTWLLLVGIGAGLISILTPCVFSMLPMVVSLFLKRSSTKAEGRKVAFQYSISIIIIFALLGLLLMVVADKQILNTFSTNWIVNVIFFIVFVVFGISFLGAFEISLPSSWSTSIDKKGNTKSFSGVFFMALTLAIVSFSCTAPFINGLIALIVNGGRMGALTGFTGYGIGLALPFSLFAIFPNWLTYINKQGGWLNAVKITLGFIELALAFKFLSNADLVQGWRLLDREIFIAIWVVIFLILGLYLLGFVRFSHDSELPKNYWGLPYLTVTRTLFAITSLVFVLYLIPGMWGAPLKGMGAFVPPMGTQDFIVASEGNMSASSTYNEHSLERKFEKEMKIYEPDAVKKYNIFALYDYNQALALSKKEHKPIMLDFTGIACVNCRKLETSLWSNPTINKMLKEDFILVSLYTDASNVDLPKEMQYESKANGMINTLGKYNYEIQSKKYNSYGQPDYFFIDENEVKLIPEGYGYSPTNANPENFIKHLQKALEKHKSLHQS